MRPLNSHFTLDALPTLDTFMNSELTPYSRNTRL